MAETRTKRDKTMNVREKIAEITTGCRSQVDLDAVVSKYNGLGNIYSTEFPGVARDEFMYEWESRKLAFRGRMTRDD